MVKGEKTLGSLDEHLTLQTKGKIKIRYGNKLQIYQIMMVNQLFLVNYRLRQKKF